MKEIHIMVNIVGHEGSLTGLNQNISLRTITHLKDNHLIFFNDDRFNLYVVQL